MSSPWSAKGSIRGLARMDARVSRVAFALFLVRCSVPPSVRDLRSWLRMVFEAELLGGFGFMSGERDERPSAFSYCSHVGQLLPRVDFGFASVLEDALGRDGSEARGSEELVSGCGVDVDGESVEVF